MSSPSSLFGSRPTVLADLLPGTWVRDVLLVVGYVAAIAASAQVAVPLPFTPVPISGQTFAVLLGAAALGSTRSVVGASAYLALGVAGLPLFTAASAVTFGYIIGFVVAAAVVGWLAERGFDRTLPRAAASMVAGNLLIYAAGVPYLAVAAGLDVQAAFAQGVLPFVPGDAVKLALATALLPGAWALTGRRGDR